MLYEPTIRVTGSFRKLLHILYERSYTFFNETNAFSSRYTAVMHFLNQLRRPQDEISNNVVCVSTKGLDQPAHMCSLIRAFASRLKLLSD